MHLEPGDAEGHHHIGHRVGLGEQVGDLLTGADVPVGHPVLLHLLLRPFGEAPALSHRLHDLEGALGVHALGDQKQHDVVTAANGLVDLGGARGDQVLGVAQPHVGAVEKPDSRTRMSNWSGWVSSSMPRTKVVPNSGMAVPPVGPKILSSS